MSELIFPAPLRALDANGNPVAAAEAFFFRTDTTTPLTVYADSAGSTAHPSPLVADANGVFPSIFNTSAFGVKVDVRDPLTDASLPGYPINLAVSSAVTTGAASSISFAPSDGIAETNVQDAIERVQTNWTGAKTGADAGIVSGTAGGGGNLSEWNADGDLVDGPQYGTSGADRLLQLTGTGALPAVDGSALTNLPGITRGTAITTTSGTEHDFAIAAGANRVTLMISGTSLAAVGFQLVQLGDAGGIENTGYTGNVGMRSGEDDFTSGFQITVFNDGASFAYHSNVLLTRIDGNTWVASFTTGSTTNDPPQPIYGAGSKSLSGELTTVRLTSTTGAAFDAGTVNILVE